MSEQPMAALAMQLAISRRLTREVGIVAGRLADFLLTCFPGPEGSVAQGRTFLRSCFEAVAEGKTLAEWSGGPMDRRPEAPHPLDRLADALKLSPAEIDLILLAGMADEHEGYAAVLRGLHPRGDARASAGLAAQLLCRETAERESLRALLESGPAAASGVLWFSDDGPFFERSLRLADALWPALRGLDVWPPAIARLPSEAVASGLEEWLDGAGAVSAAAALARREAVNVLVSADGEEVAYQRGIALARHAGVDPVGVALPPVVDTSLQRLIRIHAAARGRTPVMRLAQTAGPAPIEVPDFSTYSGAVIICAHSGSATSHGLRPLIEVRVERLGPAARRRMWRETVPELAGQAPALAARYPIEPATTAEVAADLRFLAGVERRAPTVEDVAASLRARTGLTLGAGIKLLRPVACWDDLVLGAGRSRQLREAADRLRLQVQVLDEWGFLKGRMGARGVRMLFSGPPGTGKTLAAEVLAQALSLDLLVVDISRVVSKWIGETEKNLAAVFDAAERSQAVLLFDEADALFGKRTEVSDAHDRYANLETAYLLSRLERFEGLAILSTNLRRNVDPAFIRRLEFVVDFEEPDREERHAIWRCHLPAGVPLASDVNLYELAALYPVVGGFIRNAAVAAGFLAAADGTPIGRVHFIHAIQREYDKAGLAFPGLPIDMTAP